MTAQATPHIAKTNAEVSAISREVRSRLRALGVVHGAEIQFQATTPSGHVTDITFAAGDHIRFLTRNDALRVINGTTGTVVRVTEHTNQHGTTQRIVAEVEGRRIVFDPRDLADEKGRARLGWAYASTIYGCQGLTVDHAAVLLNPSFDRHDIYVAASRARHSTALVSDKKAIDQHIQLTRSPAKNNFHATLSEHERRAWLAERLARSNVKESTLDVIELEQLSRATQLSRVREHALEAELER